MSNQPPLLPEAPEHYTRRWAEDFRRELDQHFERALLGDMEAQSALISLSGRRIRPTLVTAAAYTIKLTEDLVDVNFAGAVALTLPANPGFGQRAIVQDSSGDAYTNNITITPASGTINGAASYILANNYGRVVALYNGTQWVIASTSLVFDSPVFDDYLVPGLTLAKGSSAPDLEEFRNGMYMNAFNGTGVTVEQAFFTIHILHGMKPGTTPTFHIHWAHNQVSPSGNVKWLIDCTVTKGYGAGTYAAPETLTTIQTAPAQYVHEITDDDDMPLSSSEIEPDSVIIGRIYRDPADASDTFEADAFLVHIDLHYQRDRIGTPERNRPFAGF